MELEFKPDFAQAQRRWDAFWHKEIIDRPCAGVVAPKDGARPVPRPKYLDGFHGDYAAAVERFAAWASQHYFAGEAIPQFCPSFGPDMFAAFLGAELRWSESDVLTTWCLPCIEDWAQALPLRIDPENRWWRGILEFLRTSAELGEGKFLTAVIDLHSNADAVAAARRPERFCMDLYDCPEMVERAMRDVRALYPMVYEAVFAAGRMDKWGSSHAFYCRGRFAMTQCDLAYLVSPEMFNRFILPALREEWAYLDHSIYHLDGEKALVHLEAILASEDLGGVQWVPGAGKPRQVEWLDLLKRIQAAGKSLHIRASIEEIKQIHRELRPELVFYDTWAPSEREADEFLAWLKRNT